MDLSTQLLYIIENATQRFLRYLNATVQVLFTTKVKSRLATGKLAFGILEAF
jgi:hypothetical protein